MTFKERIKQIKDNVAARSEGKWEHKLEESVQIDQSAEIDLLAEAMERMSSKGALQDFIEATMNDAEDKSRTGTILSEALKLMEKKLTTIERKKLPKGDFAEPEKRAYPIEDKKHARNALARVSQHGSSAEKAKVRKKVHAKFPDIGKNGK